MENLKTILTGFAWVIALIALFVAAVYTVAFCNAVAGTLTSIALFVWFIAGLTMLN